MRRRLIGPEEGIRSGPLCFCSRGFSLHAATSVEATDRVQAERLCRSPEELLEKLAALVPPPRLNLVRYHGVLAPHAAGRAQIVPGPKPAHDATDAATA